MPPLKFFFLQLYRLCNSLHPLGYTKAPLGFKSLMSDIAIKHEKLTTTLGAKRNPSKKLLNIIKNFPCKTQITSPCLTQQISLQHKQLDHFEWLKRCTHLQHTNIYVKPYNKLTYKCTTKKLYQHKTNLRGSNH